MKSKYYSIAADIQGLASREQAGRVTDWRRERRREMVGLKGHQRQEMEGRLPLHSHLALTRHTFASVKVCNLKGHMWVTYCISYE